ncbi:MAG: hypothetical protein CMF28_00570 [Kiritimatiellaceae bacterium]|nr:hypothetical protein [Kiritimatiellaceae bacterium]
MGVFPHGGGIFFGKWCEMVEALKVVVLAVVQGVTEFLPVSSSGHLVLGRELLGLEVGSGGMLEVVLHAGTLVSVVVFYGARLRALLGGVVRGDGASLRYVGLVGLGIVPAVGLGWVARDALGTVFDRPSWAGAFLMVTGGYLLLTHWARPVERALRVRSVVWIGLVQMLALLPGISRSGSTICTARLLGVSPKVAAEFSFMMSIPLLLGVVIFEGVSGWRANAIGAGEARVLALGFVVAAGVGYGALRWLVLLLERGRFWRFGIYCLVVGALSLFWLR